MKGVSVSKCITIIGNPKAGSGRVVAHLQESRRSIWGYSTRIHTPENLEELSQTCRSLDPSQIEALVVVGGDGTVNQVIREMLKIRCRVPLYIFPAGTANDLASELGTPASWNRVEELVNEHSIDSIDLIDVNGIPFATVAGTGIGATLTSDLNQARDRSRVMQVALKGFKKQVYSLLTLKTIFTHPEIYQDLWIDSGNFNQRVKSPAVFVCNQGQLSGNLRVAPEIDNQDNKFNVLIVPEINRGLLISALIQLNLGKIPEQFIAFSTDRLLIESKSDRPISVFGDGDALVEARRLEFTVLPQALSVYRSRKVEALL